MSHSGANSPSKQAIISSYFSKQGSPPKEKGKKRVSSLIDLTLEDDDSGLRKRSKTVDARSTSGAAEDSTSNRSTNATQQWRYVPPSPEKTQETFEKDRSHDDVERRERHEAFKKKLLAENSIFLRRHSDKHNDTTMARSDEDEDDRGQGSDVDTDEDFRALTALFENKPRVQGKSVLRSHGSPSFPRRKKNAEIGPSGQTYTPLELQVRELKQSNPGTLIMVEVGYKYRFFGNDARIASQALGIACFTARNFLTASIPTHRLGVHIKKLLSQGHRVGVVSQTETAALKRIGDNRGGPFDRKLTHLYTAATYVDELNSVDDLERYAPPPLMCLMEDKLGGMGADERVSFGMIAICPSTGDVVWDDFGDNHMRTELEARMVHLNPAELLLPSDGLSKPTEKMLAHFSKSHTTGSNLRIERFNGLMSYTDAFSFVSEFYTDKKNHGVASESFRTGQLMAAVVGLPRPVVIVLAHAIKHLSDFSIADVFLETRFFNRFTSRAHMLLNGNTLVNLEIFQNQTDFGTHGSLLWILDRTKTKFGARLLKNWVGRPLVDMTILKNRVDAVEEIISSSSEKLVSLRETLKNLPDLAKGLCRIQYGKCTPQELAILLPAFNKVGNAFESPGSPSQVGFKSHMLNDIIASLPKLKEPMSKLMGDIQLKKAAQGDKQDLWTDPAKYPDITYFQMAIGAIEMELEEELKLVRKTLKRPSMQWTSVAGEEYLIEVKKSENALVPDTWIRVSATRTAERFHTPQVKKKIQERAQYQEAAEAAAQDAFSSFLHDIISNHYAVMRNAVNNLAIADCLLSFALVALQEGYVKPEFTDHDTLEIVDGRHPMIEALRSDPFVPNTVRMGSGEPRSKIITGPNMGGKSSSVRMIAIIAVMAQIGSYAPAKSVRLSMLDSILTRMGAMDDLARGRSTFMIEMSETSDILRTATEKSLVVLDELGRGTSTVDGMAVADATLHHLVEVTKCKTLFITHYPLIAAELERKFPRDLQNLHMGYTAETRIDGRREITFLYRLALGAATESFGIECARLAGVPESVLDVASERLAALGAQVDNRSRKKKAHKCAHLLGQLLAGKRRPGEILAELDSLVESMTIKGKLEQAD